MDPKSLAYDALHLATFRRGIRTRQAYGAVRFHPRVARYYPEGYEHEKASFMIRHALVNGRVIDAGAHIGLFTANLSQWVGKGRVWAFEASPATCDELRRTVALNHCRNVTVVNAAVGDRDGTVEFGETADPVSNANSLAQTGRTARTVRVPMVRLDDAVDRAGGPITLMKLDVEGAEHAALVGAEQILRDHRPAISMEVHPRNLGLLGSSTSEVWDLLEQAGYTLNIERDRFLSATDDFEVQAVAPAARPG